MHLQLLLCLWTCTTAWSQSDVVVPAVSASGAIIILILIVAIAMIIMLLCWRKRKRKHLDLEGNKDDICLGLADNEPTIEQQYANRLGMTTSMLTLSSHSPQYDSLNKLLQLDPTLIIPMGDLIMESRMVGEGEFGVVHKANYRGEVVAVKILKCFYDVNRIGDMVAEILKMKKLSHQHILTLRGVSFDSRCFPCIVMPFMENGSLQSYLRKDKIRKKLNISILENEDDNFKLNEATKRLMRMCLQIAEGMKYLAEKKIIHRDLAARNCMMDMNRVIKVADFGLSVAMEAEKEYFRLGEDSREKLPVKWMAPESLLDRKFSEFSDWSFGVTCWEVFSCGKVPYPTLRPGEVLEKIKSRMTLDKPDNEACTHFMFGVMCQCWSFQESDRPTFSSIVTKLSREFAVISNYLPLESLVDTGTRHTYCCRIIDSH